MSLLQMTSTSFVLGCCSVFRPHASTPWAALASPHCCTNDSHRLLCVKAQKDERQV